MKTTVKRSAGWLVSDAIERSALYDKRVIEFKRKKAKVTAEFELEDHQKRQSELARFVEELGPEAEPWLSWVFGDFKPAPTTQPVEAQQEPRSGLPFSLTALNALAGARAQARLSAALLEPFTVGRVKTERRFR